MGAMCAYLVIISLVVVNPSVQGAGYSELCGQSVVCDPDLHLDCQDNKCQCEQGYFHPSTTGRACVEKDLFRVTDVQATTYATTSTLTWTASQHGLPMAYSISISPNDGGVEESAGPLGGKVEGLNPGKMYTLTIISTVGASSGPGQVITSVDKVIYTQQEHGGFCDDNIKCIFHRFPCLNNICRCPLGQRFAMDNCRTGEAFKVTGVASTTDTTSATLTWTPGPHGLPVTYSISISPDDGGLVESAGSHGGRVVGLNPGRVYSLTITSTVEADSIYDQITTFAVNSVSTKDGFKVSGIIATKDTTSATLTWEANKFGYTVDYIISTTPKDDARMDRANTRGGRMEGLTPGKMYTLTITSVVAADSPYGQLRTSVQKAVWMKPSKPNGNGRVHKPSDQLYDFIFEGSPGEVDHYLVTFREVSSPTLTRQVSTTKVPGLQLIPGAVYSYTIVAVNGIGEQSDRLDDTLVVTVDGITDTKQFFPTGLRQGLDLTITGKSDSSLSVQWKTPGATAGNLTGYLVTYFIKSGQWCRDIEISCSDCEDPWPTSNSTCQRSTNLDTQKSHEFLNDMGSVIDLNIPDLRAYTVYTVEVQAIRTAEIGVKDSIDARTDVGAAKQVETLNVETPGTSTTAGIEIRWTPGEKTGPTDYVVMVEREEHIGSRTFTEVTTITRTGYDRTNFTLDGVIAFWIYRVSVTARTSQGSSEAKTQIVRTKSNSNSRPGQLDPHDAQVFTLSFECPVEEDRNGEISHYVVRKTDGSGGEETETIQHSETCSFVTGNFNSSLIVSSNYTFQVQVVNTDYSGNFTPGMVRRIEPKLPKLVDSGDIPLIEGPNQTRLTEEFVIVKLCSSCLLDISQGEITEVGLLVCVRKDKDCPDLPKSPSQAHTWSLAKLEGFSVPYLATPLNWKRTLKVSSDDEVSEFVVGNERTCTPDTTRHCNGPLPDDEAQVTLTVMSCTEAGCASFEYARVYRTKVSGQMATPPGCPRGMYGSGCDQTCGVHCAGSDHPCARQDGSCDLGCNPGYQGPNCSEPLSQHSEDPGQTTWGVAGGVIAAATAVAVCAVICALVWRRHANSKHHHDRKENPNDITELETVSTINERQESNHHDSTRSSQTYDTEETGPKHANQASAAADTEYERIHSTAVKTFADDGDRHSTAVKTFADDGDRHSTAVKTFADDGDRHTTALKTVPYSGNEYTTCFDHYETPLEIRQQLGLPEVPGNEVCQTPDIPEKELAADQDDRSDASYCSIADTG